MTTISTDAVTSTDGVSTVRTCQMHRIRVSTVVALVLGVVLTLVVALQLLPVSSGADATASAAGVAGNSALMPLPVFIVCAALAVLVSAAVLVSSAKDERRA